MTHLEGHRQLNFHGLGCSAEWDVSGVCAVGYVQAGEEENEEEELWDLEHRDPRRLGTFDLVRVRYTLLSFFVRWSVSLCWSVAFFEIVFGRCQMMRHQHFRAVVWITHHVFSCEAFPLRDRGGWIAEKRAHARPPPTETLQSVTRRGFGGTLGVSPFLRLGLLWWGSGTGGSNFATRDGSKHCPNIQAVIGNMRLWQEDCACGGNRVVGNRVVDLANTEFAPFWRLRSDSSSVERRTNTR